MMLQGGEEELAGLKVGGCQAQAVVGVSNSGGGHVPSSAAGGEPPTPFEHQAPALSGMVPDNGLQPPHEALPGTASADTSQPVGEPSEAMSGASQPLRFWPSSTSSASFDLPSSDFDHGEWQQAVAADAAPAGGALHDVPYEHAYLPYGPYDSSRSHHAYPFWAPPQRDHRGLGGDPGCDPMAGGAFPQQPYTAMGAPPYAYGGYLPGTSGRPEDYYVHEGDGSAYYGTAPPAPPGMSGQTSWHGGEAMAQGPPPSMHSRRPVAGRPARHYREHGQLGGGGPHGYRRRPRFHGGKGSKSGSKRGGPKRGGVLVGTVPSRLLQSSDLTLMDLATGNHILELARDQHGSRFIQQKLETCDVDSKEAAFRQLLPHVLQLCEDVFANYVVQKFLEFGTEEQKAKLVDAMRGQVFRLARSTYGCRVVQKAFEAVPEVTKVALATELEANHGVLTCVRDQNGNHVVQKCVEQLPTAHLDMFVQQFHGRVYEFSTHPYGCRVVQRLLEHCEQRQKAALLQEILEHPQELSRDQYGNYVIQHLLAHGPEAARKQLVKTFMGQVLDMSKHKFASNVIEKCFLHSYGDERARLLSEVLGPATHAHGQASSSSSSSSSSPSSSSSSSSAAAAAESPVMQMVRDQYANYVIQKILDVATPPEQQKILHKIQAMAPQLKKLMYGKHILSKVQQIVGKRLL